MFAFGKRLEKADHDIIGYDLLFRQNRHMSLLERHVEYFVNMRGDVITPNCSYKMSINKIRSSRHRIDQGLYTYRYGFKVFASKPQKVKDTVVVPVIIPKGSYFSYNLFGQILSSEVIYPNKF